MGLVLPLYAMEPDISPVIERVLHKNDISQLMSYTPPQGLYRHRQVGSEWVKRFGVSADASNIVITAGTARIGLHFFFRVPTGGPGCR